MIRIDLHSHTLHSHARDSARAMAAAAFAKGLAIFGFSEHSPRPAAYVYPEDYQDKLILGLPAYHEEVRREQLRYQGRMKVLLGLELDYIPEEKACAKEICVTNTYDYVIGGLHFQKRRGFDFSKADWEDLSIDACGEHFSIYYQDLADMAGSGLCQIAAHPDLIKLFRPQSFAAWLEKPENLEKVGAALAAMKKSSMALELSSAALRKGLGEPYPAAPVMRLAAALELPISISSDAHKTEDIASEFDALEAYARSFGYMSSVWFEQGVMFRQDF